MILGFSRAAEPLLRVARRLLGAFLAHPRNKKLGFSNVLLFNGFRSKSKHQLIRNYNF